MDVAEQLQLLQDLEARHDDLLLKLDELDKRVELVLADYAPVAKPADPPQEGLKRAA